MRIPGTAALNDEIITNNNRTHIGDQPTYSAMPPITPAIMQLFLERCNFANLANARTSYYLFFINIFVICRVFICLTFEYSNP